MKALSIKQPWASLIAHGIKDIENRTWKTKFRGKIYIHASAKDAGDMPWILTAEQAQFMTCNVEVLPPYKGKDYTKSAIIGEVEIIDCVINHPSIWAEKTPDESDLLFCRDCADNNGIYPTDNKKCDEPKTKPIYNWVLANPVLYDKPILNVKGKLSFWEFEPKQ